MNSLTILLVIAGKDYHPTEYLRTKAVLEAADINVITTSPMTPTAHTSVDNSTAQVDINLQKVDPAAYDGIFLIGGPGAYESLNTTPVHTLLNKFAAQHKPYGAICISPRILAEAHVLKDKKATGWNDDGNLETIFKKYGVTYVQKPVVIDGTIVTAAGPSEATAFGKAITQVLQKR